MASNEGPPRDLVGYGQHPPHPKWPRSARVAVSFVINYEEGAENCLLNGDKQSEHLLSDIVGAAPYEGQRHMNMESLYEYGSRAGFWRLHRLFNQYGMPVTVYACSKALQDNPDAAKAMVSSGWEIASHGHRWIDYQHVDEATERDHIQKCVAIQESITGERPCGMYQGKPNQNTRRYVVEEGGFLYDNDAYSDDLPYWNLDYGRPHLIIPYTLDNNDMKFATAQGFHTSEQFFIYLKDAFDYLYEEGKTAPKMMSIGLHCRLVGRPGRMVGLQRFLEYIGKHEGVWVCRRREIAKHWYTHFWPEGHTIPQRAANILSKI
ncbi:unnamed protein product [Vitrella brassicaformis CCMP3155]|uniref:NodB homology domain-containing protein n=1 Tax=Vitrella brassicaformis (strain CCMP3155) TaxID=1169540 RepID=A0A0G4EA69_VITBC|nr:unnamed protein product [Vitrella brassicaformis CCMP3155]|mmetsp:Transcript_23725/g.58653  ORF Transcript_23725/g.58653 Transcript_23725/m.58653 type:complete len:320 (+) Transcript_23725:89-1048(+)|eukprot:CEL92364.1 unnamed protein product [Vitrella brassicaformis CCMP3155]